MILKNIAFVAMALIVVAYTTPALATKTVTSPYVNKGRATVEWRGGLETDGDEEDVFRTRNQFAYGLTDFYEAKISVDTRDDDGGTFSDMDFENKFQLLPKGEYFVDLGVRLDYTRSLNGSDDEIGGKILLGKQWGDFMHLMNLEAGTSIGGDSSDEWSYGLSYGLSYPFAEGLSLGGEWYSDFGDFEDGFADQDHRVGPVLYGTAFENIRYQFGVLAGVSDAAPDATIKGTISYSLNF